LPSFHVLVEPTSSRIDAGLKDLLEAFLAERLEDGAIADAGLAQSGILELSVLAGVALASNETPIVNPWYGVVDGSLVAALASFPKSQRRGNPFARVPSKLLVEARTPWVAVRIGRRRLNGNARHIPVSITGSS
jgi:hypothetical protein